MRNNNCFECDNCVPIGEGDHFCDKVMNLVIEEYQPTAYFGGCKKKRRIACVKKSAVSKENLRKIIIKAPVKVIVRVRKGKEK